MGRLWIAESCRLPKYGFGVYRFFARVEHRKNQYQPFAGDTDLCNYYLCIFSLSLYAENVPLSYAYTLK